MLYLLRKKARNPLRRGGLRSEFYLTFGLLLLAQTLLAQPRDLNQYDHDSKPYYFGITLGANMSSFQTSLHSQFFTK